MADPARPRVVHLLDVEHGGEDAVLACRAAIGITEAEHHVWLIGDSRDEALAWNLGLPTSDRLSVRAGPAWRSAQTLGRLAADRITAWGRGPDAVVCWSVQAARLAEAELWESTRKVLMLTTGPGPDDDLTIWTARALAEEGDWDILTIGQGLESLWHEALVPQARAVPIPAAVPPTWSADRATVRAHLGVREGECLVFLLADPPKSGDAHRLVAFMGMVSLAGTDTATAASARSHQVARAERYVYLHHRLWDFLKFDGPVSRAMPAADIVFWDIDEARSALHADRPTGAVIMAATAAAAGVPVVSTDHLVTREVIGDTPSLIARGFSFAQYTEPVLPLADSAEHRAKLGAHLAAHWSRDHVGEFRAALKGILLTPRPCFAPVHP